MLAAETTHAGLDVMIVFSKIDEKVWIIRRRIIVAISLAAPIKERGPMMKFNSCIAENSRKQSTQPHVQRHRFVEAIKNRCRSRRTLFT
jgi:hypothetical protein